MSWKEQRGGLWTAGLEQDPEDPQPSSEISLESMEIRVHGYDTSNLPEPQANPQATGSYPEAHKRG
jgi:hypothetical protein